MKKTVKSDRKVKQVKVTHAHHKPYRKRHYALLVASLALGIAVINSVVIYTNNEYASSRLAAQSIADVFGSPGSQPTKIKLASTYGFGISYDTKRYYGSGVDATSGELYVGNELASTRAYNVIRLSDQRIKPQDSSSLKLTYYQNDKPVSSDLVGLEKAYIVEKQPNKDKLTRGTSDQRVYGGVRFLQTKWTYQASDSGVNLVFGFTTYIGLVNGSPLTVITSSGVNGNQTAEGLMNGFTVSSRLQAAAPVSNAVSSRYGQSLTLLDHLFGVANASAAMPEYTAAERIGATYGPAVVKIYNLMVGDLAIDGRVVLKDHVAGGIGSGFIVSGDGYIATNGHVAVIDARDEIVTYALDAMQQGNQVPIQDLIRMSGTTQADIAGATSQTEVAKIILQNLYDLPESRFAFVNAKQNLLVGLGEQQVDIKKLIETTSKKQEYAAEDTIEKATLVGADYGGLIMPSVSGKYTESDVAIIKIKDADYPMVRLGNQRMISQGGNLNIMGFPGIGSGNGIVSETKTAATLTTGKVSSKKKDTGDHNLIETDTEIGHGNSGGPAFDDSGAVVGIATYAVDPGGAGDGTLNYVRDIDDFKKLATKESINFTVSDTQKVWNQAIAQFYTARYKKALVNFNKVKELYPNHPRVAELTGIAQTRIANGENIDDFPVIPVVIAAVVTLTGIGLSVFFIARHKRGHNAMVQGVVAGQLQPILPGAPAQMVPAAIPPAQLFSQSAPAQVASNQPQQFQPSITAVQTVAPDLLQPQPAVPAQPETPNQVVSQPEPALFEQPRSIPIQTPADGPLSSENSQQPPA